MGGKGGEWRRSVGGAGQAGQAQKNDSVMIKAHALTMNILYACIMLFIFEITHCSVFLEMCDRGIFAGG